MKLLITLLCVVNFAFANIPKISIGSFNLSYSDPSGTASAGHFIVPNYSFEDSPNFTIEKQAGTFILETEDESFSIEGIPEQILALEKVTVRNLNLETNKSKVYLSLDTANGNNQETNIDAKALLIDCVYKSMAADLKSEVLNSCINNIGHIKIEKLANNGKDIVSNADFKFKQNHLDFKIKSGGHNIVGSGKGYYTLGLLRIKVEKAKVGIINVVNRLFKELEAIDSPKIRISKPWIEIDL